MGKRNAKGILLIGRMPQSGMTIYEKQGKISCTVCAQQFKAASVHPKTIRTTTADETFHRTMAWTVAL